MTKPRYAAKVDNNQAAIVAHLRKIGYSVELDHDDILVGRWGITGWYEVKNPDKVRKDGQLKKGTLQPSQEILRDTWKGHWKTVTTAEEIVFDMYRMKDGSNLT